MAVLLRTAMFSLACTLAQFLAFSRFLFLCLCETFWYFFVVSEFQMQSKLQKKTHMKNGQNTLDTNLTRNRSICVKFILHLILRCLPKMLLSITIIIIVMIIFISIFMVIRNFGKECVELCYIYLHC